MKPQCEDMEPQYQYEDVGAGIFIWALISFMAMSLIIGSSLYIW